MPKAVTVLDAEKWARRALLIDLFTVGLLLVVGVALIRDSYSLGLSMGEATMAGFVNRLLLDVALGITAIAWLTFRLIRHSYRAISSPS